MLSLQKNIPNSWIWGEVNPETGIADSFYYPLRYHAVSGEEYEFSFLCKPLSHICKLATVEYLNSPAEYEFTDERYNELVDKVYNDIIVPKSTNADITITVVWLD